MGAILTPFIFEQIIIVVIKNNNYCRQNVEEAFSSRYCSVEMSI